ncbi:hypothetical protein ACG3SL_13500 [Sphingomonas sp. CJ20]
MKLIALAAALAMGGTAIAQDMPSQPGASQDKPAIGTTGAGTAEAPMPEDTEASDAAMPATPGAPVGAVETRGGYMPAAPALSGPLTPGARVVFNQAPSPDVAYPAPAPRKSYPICKRGQFDQCMQRGGKR